MVSPNLDSKVPLYFDPKRIGESLYEVSNDLLKTSKKDVTSRWYSGYEQTDFFTWEDENGSLIKVQLSYCGQIFEWNIVNGVRTGYVREEEVNKAGVGRSEVVVFDSVSQALAVKNALDLIKNILVLAPKRRAEIIRNIENNLTIDSMSQEQFWKKFGELDIAYSKSKSILGFRILKKRILHFFSKLFSKK